MRVAIQIFSYLLGLPLEVLIIAALVRGAYRDFPFVFAYAVALFLASAIETPLYILGLPSKDARLLYVHTYWIDEQVLLPLIYAVVISLIYQASAPLRSRTMVRTGVIAGALLFAGITFLIHFDIRITKVGEWMTPWTRELNLCASILDLGLWALLIASRKKDHRLLILSGALGIQFTGEAIGESIRQLARAGQHHSLISYVASLGITTSNIIFLYMWWQAFRTAPAKQAAGIEQTEGREIEKEPR